MQRPPLFLLPPALYPEFFLLSLQKVVSIPFPLFAFAEPKHVKFSQSTQTALLHVFTCRLDYLSGSVLCIGSIGCSMAPLRMIGLRCLVITAPWWLR